MTDVRARITDICARMTDVCARCQQTVGYDCNCTEIERLTAERDRYKARAERAEEALRDIQELNERGVGCGSIPETTLAQIDAEPTEPITRDDERDLYLESAEPSQPTVQEAAQAIMQSKEARDTVFEAMWSVAKKHNLEATNSGGARYSITGDVVNEVYYAALRALAEGESE